MQILIASTEDFVLTEKTYFSGDEDINQTELSVDNNQGFEENNYLVLGYNGHETAELKQVSSVSADLKSITISSATKHAHSTNEPITKILYNQRKFYRATSESGTYSHLLAEGSPVDIEADSPNGTMFEDTNGLSTSWYKATYYNSTTSTETATTDAIATKAGESEHYTSLYKIKLEAGMEENYYIPDGIISDYRNEAENQAESSVATVYSLPFSSSPKIFEQITRLLAAGLLLAKEFGMEADINISKTGQRKIDRAESLLKKIRDGLITLRDDSGDLLAKTSTIKASSSNVYNQEDEGEMFNVGDEHFKMKDPDNPTS